MSFARVLAIVAGERMPLDARGSKLLWLLFRANCDAELTPTHVSIQWGHRTGTYAIDLAPCVVSWLLDHAEPAVHEDRPRGLGPVTLPRTPDGYPAWSAGRRAMWFDATRTKVTIRLRDATGVDVEQLGDPTTLDIAPRFDDRRLACPHCTASAAGYRIISGNALVCQACGRSFARP